MLSMQGDAALEGPQALSWKMSALDWYPRPVWKKRRFGVPWQGGETLSIAIGQGFNLVTPSSDGGFLLGQWAMEAQFTGPEF